VVERGGERRLIVRGEIQSVYFTDGNWARAEREYWALALTPPCPVPPRPRVLLVGLGGATQVHLLRPQRPRLVTIVERDPTMIRIANEWFGLRAVGGLEILCADAARALAFLAVTGRRFDLVVDDVSYGAPVAEAVQTARALAGLLAPTGVLALNQHTRPGARAVAGALAARLPWVRLARVRRGAENILVFAARRRRPGSGPTGRSAARRTRPAP
jgi:spermidine synthase